MLCVTRRGRWPPPGEVSYLRHCVLRLDETHVGSKARCRSAPARDQLPDRTAPHHVAGTAVEAMAMPPARPAPLVQFTFRLRRRRAISFSRCSRPPAVETVRAVDRRRRRGCSRPPRRGGVERGHEASPVLDRPASKATPAAEGRVASALGQSTRQTCLRSGPRRGLTWARRHGVERRRCPPACFDLRPREAPWPLRVASPSKGCAARRDRSTVRRRRAAIRPAAAPRDLEGTPRIASSA